MATLYRVSRNMGITQHDLLQNYAASEFYTMVLFLSWEAYSQNKYQEIMSKKQK